MRGVVEGYTRHFFNLAYCLVVTDKEQGPRTLSTKIKNLEKMRKKLTRQIVAEQQEADTFANMASYTSPAADPTPPTDSNLTPLEKLHAAQRRQLAESGGVSSLMGSNDITAAPLVNMKGKCIPGNIDLPGMMDEINHHATQLSHRGAGMFPNQVESFSTSMRESDYGDPNMTPVVFVSENGDIQIAMEVDGITCAHCVKIVETVLKGCSGTKSPIDGILDAAADRVLCQVLIKIEKSSDAKRIAFEASRNLSMVGYTAKVKEMSVVNAGGDRKATMDLGALSTAFEVIATTDPQDVFDWYTPCTCPDNGILREDCPRYGMRLLMRFVLFSQTLILCWHFYFS
jgi:copper chaperone CopZ